MAPPLSHHTAEDYVQIKRAINRIKDGDNMLLTSKFQILEKTMLEMDKPPLQR
jgi:hypothetical protein